MSSTDRTDRMTPAPNLHASPTIVSPGRARP